MSLASNFGKWRVRQGWRNGRVQWEQPGKLLVQAMWREDVFVFEVHPVPSLGPISHRISSCTVALGEKGSKSVLGVYLRGLSLPRGVVRSWRFTGQTSPGRISPFTFHTQESDCNSSERQVHSTVFLEVHLHHCTKLPRASSFFPLFIRVTAGTVTSVPFSWVFPLPASPAD